jgi:hypothetical protein
MVTLGDDSRVVLKTRKANVEEHNKGTRDRSPARDDQRAYRGHVMCVALHVVYDISKYEPSCIEH